MGRPAALAVLARPDAFAPEHVAAVRESPFTYLVGDSPMHLRSVLKDTPLWEPSPRRWPTAAVVAASGPAAMALCDPMTDPRGGAFTLGLGLARPMAVVPGAEGWSHDRLHRTLGLGLAFPVVTLATGAAVAAVGGGLGGHRGGRRPPGRRRGRPGGAPARLDLAPPAPARRHDSVMVILLMTGVWPACPAASNALTVVSKPSVT